MQPASNGLRAGRCRAEPEPLRHSDQPGGVVRAVGIPGAFLQVPMTALLTIVFCECPGIRPLAVLPPQNGKI